MNKVFSLYGKFDESRKISEKVFKNIAWIKHPYNEPKKNIKQWLKWPLHNAGYFMRIYFHWLISKGINLFVSSLIWIVLFSLLYFYLDNCCVNSLDESWQCLSQKLIESASLFVTLSLPGGIENKGNLEIMSLNFVNSVTGALHIGLFITYLFGMLSRK